MKQQNVKITRKEYSNKEIKPVFGGSKVLVHYNVETVCEDGIVNKYTVTCNISHIEVGAPEMEVVSVIARTNNRSTLIAEAVADLCGWQWDTICETEAPELSPEEADAA